MFLDSIFLLPSPHLFFRVNSFIYLIHHPLSISINFAIKVLEIISIMTFVKRNQNYLSRTWWSWTKCFFYKTKNGSPSVNLQTDSSYLTPSRLGLPPCHPATLPSREKLCKKSFANTSGCQLFRATMATVVCTDPILGAMETQAPLLLLCYPSYQQKVTQKKVGFHYSNTNNVQYKWR